MIVPKATVRVVDRLDPALAPAVVANVPVGLALFASLTSQVGDGLTRLTEQAFTLPDDLAYQRHGLIFGARLAASATRLEVTDAVFARNLRNYARQCVFHALLLGHISADDLRESTDLWGLVTATGTPSAGASPARMFELADPAARRRHRGDAHRARDRHLRGGRRTVGCPVERRDRTRGVHLRAAHLPRRPDRSAGPGRAAGGAARRPRLPDRRLPFGGRDHAPADGAERGPRRRRAVGGRGRQRRRAAGPTPRPGRRPRRSPPTGRSGARPRPGCRSFSIVFECLYVGAFPMAVLLMLTPAGTAIFRSYVTGLVWLQSWGPLYAVLHRISMGEAAERMSAAAAMPGGDIGISLIAQAGIRAVASDVAVMSGYLSMSVPFPRRRARLRIVEGHRARDLGARRRPGCGLFRRARGHHRQPLARQHRLRHPPLREPGGAPDPHLRPCRYRPLYRLRACRGGVHHRTRRHADRRCRQRHQPHPGRRRPALGVARDQPRDPRGRGPRPLAALVGGRRARRATPRSPTRPA